MMRAGLLACLISALALKVSMCAGAKLRAGGPLEAAGDILESSPISVVADGSVDDAAGQILRGIASVQAPNALNLQLSEDPVPQAGILSCDRDYASPCPEGFELMKSGGAGEHMCSAGSSYSGPCADEPLAPQKLSETAKQRWSGQCMAFWPCKGCAVSFSAPCPQGWEPQGSG